MCDFYSIEFHSLEEAIPFYCPSHARELIDDYSHLKKQLNHINSSSNNVNNNVTSLKELRSEFATEEQNLTEDPLSLMNITNLNHPEFNFLKTSMPGNKNVDLNLCKKIILWF